MTVVTDDHIPDPRGPWLRIIQVNDVYELTNFPHFKSLVDDLKNKADTTLVILAGDFLAPSLLSSLDKGKGMVDCMNVAGITHVCLGNHEADVSMKDLQERIHSNSTFQWINTNMRQLDEKIGVTTLPHDVVEVTHNNTTKKVGLLGLLTEDPSVYRPGVFAGSKIELIIPTTQHYMKEIIEPLQLDLTIPLTHQRMNDDREFMKTFGGNRFPLILGGHDHEIYDETIQNSRCVKTGMDGNHTAIHDIVWNGCDNNHTIPPQITVQMIPTTSYPACPKMMARVAGHERILQELNRAKLFRFRDWLGGSDEDDDDENEPNNTTVFTTKDNRLGQDNGTSVLATILRMGMRAECGLMNAGNIRGGKTYTKEEWFTWSDLKAEIPFTVGMTAVALPGWLMEDMINDSRTMARQDPPVASGGYIATCNNIVFDEEQQRILSIQGEPFDPQREYLTSFPANWFEGMDQHTPLLEWAKGTCYEHAKESSAKPSKEVVVEVFSALLWLEIGSFEELDTNNDGFLTRDEVHAAALQHFGDDVAGLVVDNVFSVADCDRDGKISPVDMMIVKYVAEDMHNHVATEEEIETMQKVAAETLGKFPTDKEVRKTMKILKSVLDQNFDGKITRLESMAAIGEVRRRSLLM